MADAKHTPGPWNAANNTVYALHGKPPRNRFSALIQGARRDDAGPEELLANARLIAAAPLMYGYIKARADAGDKEAQAIVEAAHAGR